MNAIQLLERRLRERFPAALVAMDPPKRETGTWWLDVGFRDSKLHIGWSGRNGFGVSADDPAGFGEGHDEVYKDAEATWRRVRTLLLSGSRTVSPFHGSLRKLREEKGVSQVELAQRLAIQQAGVSKIERRDDPLLSSIRAFAAALGGELELRVVFPDGVRVLTSWELVRRTSAERGRKRGRRRS